MYFLFFFFKQKTAYEMRISDWSSDVCSADLQPPSLAITGFDERHCIFRANAKATDLDYTHRSLTPLFNAKIFAKRLGQRLAALRAEAAALSFGAFMTDPDDVLPTGRNCSR